ncbi:MAG: glycosyltransferase [Beutenbergiaceae bacterium]
MRIAFLTPWSVASTASWSGVIAPMYAALGERAEVIPVETNGIGDAFIDRALCRLLDGQWGRYLTGHALPTAARHARVVRERLRHIRPDVVLAVAASQDVALLCYPAPVVHVSDTTFTAIREYYPIFSNLNPLSAVQARVQADLSSRRASWTVAATAWARDALIRDDGIEPETITVAPFGPATAPSVWPRPDHGHDCLRLLMVASDWERKGGPDVLAAASAARQRGVAVELTVVGSVPDDLPGWVRRPGRLDRQQMAAEYERCDVVIELARSSAAGVVLTDAAAFGLPVVARRTGGVETIVTDRVTGYLVTPEASATDVAEVLAILADPAHRAALGRAARAAHESSLNWGAWADAALESCRSAQGAPPPASSPWPQWQRNTPGRRLLMVSLSLPTHRPQHAGGRYVSVLAEELQASHDLVTVVPDGPANRTVAEDDPLGRYALLGPARQSHGRERWGYRIAHRLQMIAQRFDPAGPNIPLLYDLAQVPELRELVETADLIDLQWPDYAKAAAWFRRINPRARIVSTYHDVLEQRFGRMARGARGIERMKLTLQTWWQRSSERRGANASDQVVTFSAKDADLLARAGVRAPIRVVDPPLGFGDPPTWTPPTTPVATFVGPLTRPENDAAVRWLVTDIWPRVRSEVPTARLTVVGAGASAELQRMVGLVSGVELAGFVDDLDGVYAGSSVVVVPLHHGAGVKFKVVEALLAGVPIVTTTVGAEGIGGPELFVALTDDAATFAAGVVQALNAPDREAAAAAQAVAADRYGYQKFASAVAAVYGKPSAARLHSKEQSTRKDQSEWGS